MNLLASSRRMPPMGFLATTRVTAGPAIEFRPAGSTGTEAERVGQSSHRAEIRRLRKRGRAPSPLVEMGSQEHDAVDLIFVFLGRRKLGAPRT